MIGASVYHCNICCKSFKDFLIFEGHFTFNLKCRAWNGWFMQCYLCNYKFRHLAELKYHLQGHHSKCSEKDSSTHSKSIASSGGDTYPHHCQICNRRFKQKVTLKCHLKVHAIGTFTCKICHIRFTKNSLTSHVKRNHPKLLRGSVPNAMKYITNREQDVNWRNLTIESYQCEICKIFCSGKEHLEQHKKHHKGNYKCEVCHISFTKQSLWRHVKKAHPTYQKETKLQCNICPRICPTQQQLNQHMKVHINGEYQCTICRIPFTRFALVLHRARFHPELRRNNQISTEVEEETGLSKKCEPLRNFEQNVPIESYQCKICKIFCSGKERLEQHKRHHKGDYKCKVCNIKFTKQSLWRHMKQAHPTYQKEIKVSKVQCNICPITCPTQQQLDQHMKVHINGEYQCTICRIPFTRFALVLHRARFHPELRRNAQISIKLEEKEDSHDCSICEKSFKRNYYLQMHMKSHKSMNNLIQSPIVECYVCNNLFSTVRALKNHLNKHKIYEQWVDPSNVYLSNWSFENAQEILQNQPLVLVENLDIRRINLKSLTNSVEEGSTTECELIKSDSIPLNDIGNIENGFDVVRGRKRFDSQREIMSEIEKTDDYKNCHKNIEQSTLSEQSSTAKPVDSVDCFSNNESEEQRELLQISNEQQSNSPTYIDEDVQVNVEDDCVSILEVPEEFEELPISEQRINSTTSCKEDKVREVIEIISDSDDDVETVEDTSESFFCYFCNGIFYSLNQLGVHVNVCPQSMI